jgi:hypothetical protein
MNQHIPGNHLTKIEIPKKVCFVSAKIKVMAIYHRSPLNVNTFYQNFTIMFFILYYGKAIKRESGKVEKA